MLLESWDDVWLLLAFLPWLTYCSVWEFNEAFLIPSWRMLFVVSVVRLSNHQPFCNICQFVCQLTILWQNGWWEEIPQTTLHAAAFERCMHLMQVNKKFAYKNSEMHVNEKKRFKWFSEVKYCLEMMQTLSIHNTRVPSVIRNLMCNIFIDCFIVGDGIGFGRLLTWDWWDGRRRWWWWWRKLGSWTCCSPGWWPTTSKKKKTKYCMLLV